MVREAVAFRDEQNATQWSCILAGGNHLYLKSQSKGLSLILRFQFHTKRPSLFSFVW